uniref:C2H2-type domain-containing protein n=1 Tax=Periophthalmus magnuspinnatus TaxID=409849 RepID=A0A3B4B218_9GOBI
MDAYLGVTCHYLSDNFELSTILLGVQYFPVTHTAAHITEAGSTMMAEWGIADKVCAMVTDGARNIVESVNCLSIQNIHCFAHLLNHVVKKSISQTSELDTMRSKARKIVGHFKSSCTAKKKLAITQSNMGMPQVKLVQEVETRWNSTFAIGNDEDWKAPFSCSAAQKETEANGDFKQVQTRARGTTVPSPQNKSAPETSATVDNGDICSVCKKTFARKRNLVGHMRTHTGDKPYSCSICKKTFTYETSLYVHKRTHTGDKPYSCLICKKKFSQKSSVAVHMRTHTGDKPYSCSICKKRFTHSTGLQYHLRTHTGEKPYNCSVCNTQFTSIHMRTHTGEKPFSCSICHKRLTSNYALKCHMRSHTGEKPYSCSICNARFTSNASLKCHMRIHTGEKPFSCSVCNKWFSSSSTLSRHMRTHTEEKRYKVEFL